MIVALELDGLLVTLRGLVELHELVVGDARLIAQHRVFGISLPENLNGLAIHLARHQDIATLLRG